MDKHQNNYVSSLKFSELINAIRDSNGPFIIEGVCLLAVIERIGVRLGSLVYVKRTRHGIWVDEEICNQVKPVDEVIKKEEEYLLASMEWYASQEGIELPSEKDAKLPPLSEEIILYHAKYRPLLASLYTFEARHK